MNMSEDSTRFQVEAMINHKHPQLVDDNSDLMPSATSIAGCLLLSELEHESNWCRRINVEFGDKAMTLIGKVSFKNNSGGNENPYQTTNQSTSSLLPLRFFSGSSPPSLAHHRFLRCHFSLWSLFAFSRVKLADYSNRGNILGF
ncbi:hypothetical protein CsatB_002910 [Cannabis sativa]